MSLYLPTVAPYNIYGLNVLGAGTTTISVTYGQCTDTTNQHTIALRSASITADLAINGVNGLDTGTIAASAFYYVFVIAKPQGNDLTPALQGDVLLSLKYSNPVLPEGYAYYRRIGTVKTQGSSLLGKFTSGEFADKENFWSEPIAILTDGTETSLTPLDCSAGVPTLITPTKVKLIATFTPAIAGDTATIVPGYVFYTTGTTISGSVAGVPQKTEITTLAQTLGLIPGSPVVPMLQYMVATGGSLTLQVLSYTDSLAYI